MKVILKESDVDALAKQAYATLKAGGDIHLNRSDVVFVLNDMLIADPIDGFQGYERTDIVGDKTRTVNYSTFDMETVRNLCMSPL